MRTKRKASLLVVAMIFALTDSGATPSHDPAPAPGTTIPTLDVDRNRIIEQMKTDILHLASAPRYSTEQYARAAAYVRAQARAVGLDAVVEPASGLSSWERGDSDRCELLLPDGSTRLLRIAALAKSVEGEVKGELVGVNYFFEKNQGPPPHRFDEGNQKRIVFFSRRLERSRFLDGYLKAVVQRSHGASWAAAYGAAAALVRSVQTGEGPPHAGGVTYATGAPKIPAAALNVEDADRLDELLRDGKVSVRLKIAPRQKIREQDNLVVRIPGTTRPQEIVLLGAHLDSYDITPGAADDASGVAAVLAVMRELARNPPARTVLLVFFADEEVNLSGGLAFAKSHEKEMPNMVAALEMDDGDGPPRALQITSSQAETGAAMRSLRRIAEGVGPEADGLELLADTAGYGADIEPLWNELGVPEIAILQDLTAFFDRHHAENDTPSAVDMEGFGQTTFLLMRVVQVLASGAVTPPRRIVEDPRSPLP